MMLNVAWVLSPLKLVLDVIQHARKKRARLARFRGKGARVQLGKEPIYVAWDGPLDELAMEPAPRRLTSEELVAVVERIREVSGLEAKWDEPGSLKGVDVYETDRDRWRKRLQGRGGREQHWVLKVYP